MSLLRITSCCVLAACVLAVVASPAWAQRFGQRRDRGGNGGGPRNGENAARDEERRSSDRDEGEKNQPKESGSSSPAKDEPATPKDGPASAAIDISKVSSQFITRADSMLKECDANKNGVLEESEWTYTKTMNKSADLNGDGKLSREELIAKIDAANNPNSQQTVAKPAEAKPPEADKPAESKPAAPPAPVSRFAGRKSYRARTAAELLPSGLPAWFSDSDKNRDGQIQMSEYTREWSDSKVREFAALDRNGDGIVTPKEALSSKR